MSKFTFTSGCEGFLVENPFLGTVALRAYAAQNDRECARIYTTVLVDSGVYVVVRYPQYLGFVLFVLSLVLMSQRWLSVISGVLGSVLYYEDVLREEQRCVEKFSDD